MAFSQLWETQVHNGMNLDPVISKQTQCFEYLAPGSINWLCIDTRASSLQRPSVENGMLLQCKFRNGSGISGVLMMYILACCTHFYFYFLLVFEVFIVHINWDDNTFFSSEQIRTASRCSQ